MPLQFRRIKMPALAAQRGDGWQRAPSDEKPLPCEPSCGLPLSRRTGASARYHSGGPPKCGSRHGPGRPQSTFLAVEEIATPALLPKSTRPSHIKVDLQSCHTSRIIPLQAQRRSLILDANPGTRSLGGHNPPLPMVTKTVFGVKRVPPTLPVK